MKFGALPLDEAHGAILAHSIRLAGRALKKGRVLDQDDLDALRDAGEETVVAVLLEPTDLDENEAARRIATACAGDHTSVDRAFTGRCNIRADTAGVLVVGASQINVPVFGGTLVPSLDVPLFVTGNGNDIVHNANWLANLSPGFEAWFQVAFLDPGAGQNFSASNGVKVTVP